MFCVELIASFAGLDRNFTHACWRRRGRDRDATRVGSMKRTIDGSDRHAMHATVSRSRRAWRRRRCTWCVGRPSRRRKLCAFARDQPAHRRPRWWARDGLHGGEDARDEGVW